MAAMGTGSVTGFKPYTEVTVYYPDDPARRLEIVNQSSVAIFASFYDLTSRRMVICAATTGTSLDVYDNDRTALGKGDFIACIGSIDMTLEGYAAFSNTNFQILGAHS